MMFLDSEKKIMQRYFLMFMFGVVFVILMVVQKLFFKTFLFYFVEVIELVAVYLIIRNFTKRELRK